MEGFIETIVRARLIGWALCDRKLFWSDWDRAAPKLEWSNLDGSEREVFLEGNAVRLPNSLAIDFDRDELCWADAGTKSIGEPAAQASMKCFDHIVPTLA